jgi:hypothetical protein
VGRVAPGADRGDPNSGATRRVRAAIGRYRRRESGARPRWAGSVAGR